MSEPPARPVVPLPRPLLKERLARAQRQAFLALARPLPQLACAEVVGDWPALADGAVWQRFGARNQTGCAAQAHALPIRTASLGGLLLTHVLDGHSTCAAVLAEAERVLTPGGQLLIAGLNPWSLCGLREWAAGRGGRDRLSRYLRAPGSLRAQLLALGLPVEAVRTVFYQPPLRSSRSLDEGALMDRLGPRLLPGVGGAYLLAARKHRAGLRPLWTPARGLLAAPGRALSPAVRADVSV